MLYKVGFSVEMMHEIFVVAVLIRHEETSIWTTAVSASPVKS